LRSADIRFLLPFSPSTASISPSLPDFAAGFEEAGVVSTSKSPDVAVLARAEETGTLNPDRQAVIFLGRGGQRALRRRAVVVRRFLALPEPAQPHLIVPADRPLVARYAIRTWTGSDSVLRRMRNELAGRLIGLGALPDLDRSVTVGLVRRAAPYVVAPAREYGVGIDCDWFLTLGLGDVLTRAVFHLFDPDADHPSYVLKFSRVPGHTSPFERDERGLRLAASVGGATAARAPAFIGRFEADGLPASLERAAVGRRLTYVLQSRLTARAEKLRRIDAIAAWIVQLGIDSAAPPGLLEPERRRLRDVVLPRWHHASLTPDLVDSVPDVPAVLQHNDLGCWNLIAGTGTFTAIDWESARRHGFPLWDLVYFLVDALVHLDGAWHASNRERHAARLFRGEINSSEVLIRWLSAGAESLSIPREATAPLLTLAWLHHGLSASSRSSDLRVAGARRTDEETYGEWMARVWLTSPRLGPQWDAWSR
jgi:hypothetical protein